MFSRESRHLIVGTALFFLAPLTPSLLLCVLAAALGLVNFACAADERAKGLWQ